MKTAIQQITVNDVVFDVEYNYSKYRPATYYYPPEEAEVEITAVLLDGSDVTELLSEWTINQIFEKIEAPTRQEELEEIAELRFEEMRDMRLFKD